MTVERDRFDVLVVGAGLAGITAAAAAAQTGARVELLSSGLGSFILGGGVVDVGELFSAEAPGTSCASTASLGGAFHLFSAMTAAAGCDYRGDLSARGWIPTLLGTFQTAAMAPRYTWVDPPASQAKIMVCGIEGLVDFDASFMAERLNASARQLGMQGIYEACVVNLPWEHRPGTTALEIANEIDRHATRRAELISRLRPLTAGASLLLLPAVLGIEASTQDLAQAESSLGCQLRELATLPPSVIGLRLFRRLEAYLKTSGVTVTLGFRVDELLIHDGHCDGIKLNTPGRARVHHAEAVVLASGDSTSDLLKRSLPGSSSKPLAIDGNLQATQHGQLVVENLFLAGCNLPVPNRRNGNARDILTGYQASMRAAERVRYCAEK